MWRAQTECIGLLGDVRLDVESLVCKGIVSRGCEFAGLRVDRSGPAGHWRPRATAVAERGGAQMHGGVTVLDFDHSYKWQGFLRDLSAEWIDLTDLVGTKRYCARETLAVIGQRLRQRRQPGVTLIGSGNYHYVTYLLLSEIDTPFTLVLFDYHSDMLDPPDETVVSCGSWVLKALRELPLLRQVLIIGARPEAVENFPRESSLLRHRVFIFDPVTSANTRAILPVVMSRLSNTDVYVSIDKDVLDPADAVTDWEQGTMKLAELTRLMRFIASYRRLCGADICGEFPVSPVEVYSPWHREAVRKNARANRLLLDALHGTGFTSWPLSS